MRIADAAIPLAPARAAANDLHDVVAVACDVGQRLDERRIAGVHAPSKGRFTSNTRGGQVFEANW